MGMLFIQFITLDNPRPTVINSSLQCKFAGVRSASVHACSQLKSCPIGILVLSLIKEMQAQLAQQLKRVAVRKMPFIEFSGRMPVILCIWHPSVFFQAHSICSIVAHFPLYSDLHRSERSECGVGMLFIQFITLDNPRPTVTNSSLQCKFAGVRSASVHACSQLKSCPIGILVH